MKLAETTSYNAIERWEAFPLPSHPENQEDSLRVALEIIFLWGPIWVVTRPISWSVELIRYVFMNMDSELSLVRKFKNEIYLFISQQEGSFEEFYEIVRRYEVMDGFPQEDLIFLKELIDREEFKNHFKEILSGANVLIPIYVHNLDDLKTRFPIFGCAFERESSHKSLPGSCWGINNRIVNHALFWIDENNYLRFQLENSGYRAGFLENMKHIFGDFLTYKIFREQVGPFGTSLHTENNPIVIISV